MLGRYLPILLIPATVILAQPEIDRIPGRMTMDDDLQLAKEQREQIVKIRGTTQKQVIDLRADVEKLQIDLREQLRSDKPNRKAIDATLKEISDRRSAIQKLHVDQHLQVREILTPEQRELFDHRPFGRHYFDMGMGKRSHGRHPGGKRHRW